MHGPATLSALAARRRCRAGRLHRTRPAAPTGPGAPTYRCTTDCRGEGAQDGDEAAQPKGRLERADAVDVSAAEPRAGLDTTDPEASPARVRRNSLVIAAALQRRASAVLALTRSMGMPRYP